MTDNIMDEIERINNIKRMKNKKKLHSILDKYGTLENFHQNSTMAEDFEYQFAQGDDIIAEVEQERQAMSGLPKTSGSSLDDTDMAKNASIYRARNRQNTFEDNLFSSPIPSIDNFILKQYANNQHTNTQSDASVSDTNDDDILEKKYSTLLSNVRKHLLDKKGEDFKKHIYLDTKGVITTGAGTNIDNFDTFMNVGFMVNNRPATYQEKLDAYNRFKELSKRGAHKNNYNAEYYDKESNLRITPEVAINSLNKHTLNDLKKLKEGFEDFDIFPLPLQEVLMDIRYNTGNVSESNWPNLHKGIRTKNLTLITDNVSRKDVSIDRNNWAKNKILSIKQPW
jgi:hypothetical protein